MMEERIEKSIDEQIAELRQRLEERRKCNNDRH